MTEIEVPGKIPVSFDEKGPRVVRSLLTRDLKASDVIIVTLCFQKSGNLRLVTAVE